MDGGGGHMTGMGGMNMSSNGTSGGGMMMKHRHMMMHMTFFWGKNTEILFHMWPGFDNLGMYVVALVVVFALALLVEWLSHCRLIGKNTGNVAAGLIQTLMYGVRAVLVYMVMLAVMSFNGGVFLVAVAGHMAGFMVFGSRVFKKAPPPSSPDLPPMSC